MTRRTVSLGAALLGALGAAALSLGTAHAQTAAALGKPLVSQDMAAGTVSVRVVAGTPSAPVVGTEVTLTVNGTPRQARTDSAGRAQFTGLPVGATVVAKVIDEDKAEHASDSFPLPDGAGVRLMLSTKPWQAGAGGGAPFAGGAAGMPNPRQLSGEARPERGDAPGTITVRVTYDDFKDTPEGVPVTLVGYAWDDTTTYKVIKTDKAGRAEFTDLDRSGGTSYFAMTQLPRNGGVDRIMSLPMLLDAQSGFRLALSSEKRDSRAPVIDDLVKADAQPATPAGKVRIGLEGAPAPDAVVSLIDVETKKPIAQGKVAALPPDPTRMTGGDQFDADPKIPPGKLTIEAAGGPGQRVEPFKDAEIQIVPASPDPAAPGAVVAHTGDGGMVDVDVPAGPHKAIYTVNGRSFTSKEFDVTKGGGQLTIRVNWDDASHLEAVLDAGEGTRVVYAEATSRNQHYRSMPFQLRADTGSKISVYVYPRVMLRFIMQAYVDDQQLAVQGRLEVMNSSWTPYKAGPDGLLLPLPKGFRGGIVYDPDQAEVAVAAGEGFRIIRPIPPGNRQFHGGFTLPVDDGKVAWAFDLPLGAFQSELDIKQTPGMRVEVAGDVKPVTRTVPQGTFSVIAPLNIRPNQSMALTIEGLPSPPAWRTWVPMVVGLLVVGVMLGGVWLAFTGKKPDAAEEAEDHAARRQALLDELVALERSGGSIKRREQLLAELESIWS